MFNKRGVDAVVATVLIIMITVAAVAIIWSTVIPMIKESASSVNAEKVSLNIDTAGGYTVFDPVTNYSLVQIKRGVDQINLSGFRITFFNGRESKSVEVTEVPSSNSAKLYSFDMGTFGVPQTVSISPIFSNGKEGEIVDKIESTAIKTEGVNVTLEKVMQLTGEINSLSGELVDLTSSSVASMTEGACGGYRSWGAVCPSVDTLANILSDNSLTTYYGFKGVDDVSLEFDYTDMKTINQINLTWTSGNRGAAPGDYSISYWDGSSWISPTQFSSLGGTIKQELYQLQTFTLPTSVQTKKIKLLRRGIGGGGGIGLAEFNINGITSQAIVSKTSGNCGGFAWGAVCPASLTPERVLSDGLVGEYYGGRGDYPLSWEFAFSNPKTIKEVKLYWQSGGGGAAPGNYYISYWNGTEWFSPTELSSEGGIVKQELNQYQTFNLSIPVKATKLKLYREAYGGGGGIGLAEFQIRGFN